MPNLDTRYPSKHTEQSICFENGLRLLLIRKDPNIFNQILEHQPSSNYQRQLYSRIQEVANLSISDFYVHSVPTTWDDIKFSLDPSLPHCDRPLKFWFNAANERQLLDGWKNKLITTDEYIVFLANFIYKLVEIGMPLDCAWSIVADNHHPLKAYLASKASSALLEEIKIFYNIAISGKFIAHDIYQEFLIFALHCKDCSKEKSQSSIYLALGEKTSTCKRDHEVFEGAYALLTFRKKSVNYAY